MTRGEVFDDRITFVAGACEEGHKITTDKSEPGHSDRSASGHRNDDRTVRYSGGVPVWGFLMGCGL